MVIGKTVILVAFCFFEGAKKSIFIIALLSLIITSIIRTTSQGKRRKEAGQGKQIGG